MEKTKTKKILKIKDSFQLFEAIRVQGRYFSLLIPRVRQFISQHNG
jgi:hypothetical protein